jgi:phosphoserine phosphatase
VAAEAGFDAHKANELLDDGKVLTGLVCEPVLGREAKREMLESEAVRLAIALDNTIAVGDGANDLDMIRLAGLGVAYHAKPLVSEAAQVRVRHGDLRTLLYLQGYRDDEIVER